MIDSELILKTGLFNALLRLEETSIQEFLGKPFAQPFNLPESSHRNELICSRQRRHNRMHCVKKSCCHQQSMAKTNNTKYERDSSSRNWNIWKCNECNYLDVKQTILQFLLDHEWISNEFELEHRLGGEPATIDFLVAVYVAECVDLSRRRLQAGRATALCCTRDILLVIECRYFAWIQMSFPSADVNMSGGRIQCADQVAVRDIFVDGNEHVTWPNVCIWKEKLKFWFND